VSWLIADIIALDGGWPEKGGIDILAPALRPTWD
jgi:hypothetical protein